MGTDVKDAVHPVYVEPVARSALVQALQPLLASEAPMTLVLLGAGVPAEVSDDALCEVRAALDEIELLARSGIRRTDVVLRCSAHQCALILLHTGTEGALRVMNRLRRYLDGCPEVFLAERGPAFQTSDELIRQLVPVTLPPAQVVAFAQERRPSHKGQRALRPLDAHARARALGVPYLPGPHRIPSSVRNLLPLEVMQQLQCLPLGRDRNSLTVALADPTDRGALLRLEQLTGMTIFPVMTDPELLAPLVRPARRNVKTR